MTLQSLGLLASKLGYELVTFRAIGDRSIVVRLQDGRSSTFDLPPAGERLSVDALQAALRRAT